MTASRAPLGRDGLRLKIAVQRVRLGTREYRVISPARPLRNGALYRSRSTRYSLCVDRADGRRVGTLWLLAARSPHSLVYLPMRAAPTAPGIGREDEEPLDLVLTHPSLQFRRSRWTRLRQLLSRGSARRHVQTASVPLADLPSDGTGAPAPEGPGVRVFGHDQDVPRRDVFARTLFLTGGAAAFREGARGIFAVTAGGPPAAATELYIAGHCNYHVCRELYWWQQQRHHGAGLHVEFSPSWSR